MTRWHWAQPTPSGQGKYTTIWSPWQHRYSWFLCSMTNMECHIHVRIQTSTHDAFQQSLMLAQCRWWSILWTSSYDYLVYTQLYSTSQWESLGDSPTSRPKGFWQISKLTLWVSPFLYWIPITPYPKGHIYTNYLRITSEKHHQDSLNLFYMRK